VQALGADAEETRIVSDISVKLRSMLFIPGDSEKKLSKGDDCGADAIIIDLEDSVAAGAKAAARELARDYLDARRHPRSPALWVRINALDSGQSRADLEAVVGGAPDGIILPKSQSADDVVTLASRLDRLEAECGLDAHAIGILPITTETPNAIFHLGSYGGCSERLRALSWGAEDLSAAIGASANKEADGCWTAPYQLARSLCLFGAHAAEVLAIDTIYDNFRDAEGLRASCEEARRDGFLGKLAIHPAQVPVINEAFTPSGDELDEARRVVELFAAHPGAGALSLDGRMVDFPHLKRAQHILALVD
jgi:citrate lyase subunit beta/citryl-CoA lyase